MVRVGIDLVDLERFRKAIGRTPQMVDRLFTHHERSYALAARDPTARLGARFAVKEAVMKVLGVGLGGIAWHDVEVVHLETGQPELKLFGRALSLSKKLGIRHLNVSMSHSNLVAVAVVVGDMSEPVDQPPLGGVANPPR